MAERETGEIGIETRVTAEQTVIDVTGTRDVAVVVGRDLAHVDGVRGWRRAPAAAPVFPADALFRLVDRDAVLQ